MNKKVFQIISAFVVFALTLGSFTSAGASAQRGTLGISTPTVYDCKNGTMAGITIKNTHDVTVKNCNIVVTSEMGIQVTDSYNVLIDNVDISSTYPEGSGINLESTVSGLTHDVTIQNFHIHGPMGWGIAGSYQSLLRITVKNGTIDSIGQAGGEQKHGIYLNNWVGSLIEDVTIKDSWNSGIKIVGVVSDLHLNRVTISNSGRSGGSGPGISLDSSTITGLVITGCNISHSNNPAIWTIAKVNGVTVDGCNFFNNYYAVEIPSGGTGWRVVNNVGYNQASYTVARTSLQLDGGTSDIANNFFDYNNWYFDGAAPIRVGGSSLSLTAWQAKGADIHSISVNPNAVATPTKVATLTPISTSLTPTASAVPASPTPAPAQPSFTPTASSVPASPTPAPVQPSFTPTASSVPASPTPVPAQPSFTPTASSVPVLPTSTPVQPSATPIPSTPTASAVPVRPTSTSVQSTAVAPQQNQPVSEKIYDSKLSSFVYSSDWRDVAMAAAYGGSFKKTNEDGSVVTFTFTGQSFSLLYTTGPAYGKINVSIDGHVVKTIDENGSTTGYQKRWNYPNQLTLGKHTITIVSVGNDAKKASIDAVIVR